ncbi:MAG: ribosome biogenesis GTPase YlqF [Bacillota bacterium]|nr:ribosome biogenesis GTPase YlqF [Bacillota bacterium]
MNWYPGHMKKTYDMLKENLKVVDLVIIILDSRVPNSSLNPQLDKLIINKEKIYLMNKADISDNGVNKEWLKYFKDKNIIAVENNSIKNKKNNKLFDCISKVEEKIRIKFEKKGFKNKTIRILVVGVPNTGKSTFINYLTKRKSVKTGNKPGVTRGKQWIKIKNKFEILDTPGILWPNLNNDKIKFNLAVTGLIKDNIIDDLELSMYLLKYLKTNYTKILNNRYNLNASEDEDAIAILEKISKNKGYILKDNEIDYERAAITILKDFRNGDLGKISLERPEEG